MSEAVTVLDMDALSPAQRDVLGAICCSDDAGHAPATLAALERKGLIVSYEDELPGRWPVTVTRWEPPIGVHMQWAAWCATQPDEDD